MTYAKDVFLCHAYEDKEPVVRPLAARLVAAGISCWIDEAEIRWGESIPMKVQEGLKVSRFVIVILSRAFLGKHWPQRELNAVLNQEAGSGEVRVLPLLVKGQMTGQMLSTEFPLLSDKRYLEWDGHGDNIVAEICSWLGRPSISPLDLISNTAGRPLVPMPRIKRLVTDQDKAIFLRDTFKTITEYFQVGLKLVNQQDASLSGDFEPVTNMQFLAKIYQNGANRCACKIWRGGFTGEGIAYAEGSISISENNSYNELLTVEQEDNILALRMLMGGGFGYQGPTSGLTPAQAAESLWQRFIAPLAY